MSWVSGPHDSDNLKVLSAIHGVVLVSLAQAMGGSSGEKGVGMV